MKKNTTKDYARALFEVTREAAKGQRSAAIKSFADLLARDHELKRADKIIEEFIAYAQKKEGIVDLEVVSIKKISAATLGEIKNVFGKKSEISETVDPEILGGLKIKTADKIFDGSLKTQINRLKRVML